jgi:protein SCO1/2
VAFDRSRRALLASLASLAAAARAAADERLIDQAGRPVPMDELRGRWLLVYFGYTACPDACPTALARISRALALLGPAGAGLVPVFVTVDPARDRPEVLRTYLAHFSPRIRGLTGSSGAVAEAARTFGVPVRARGGGVGFDHGVLIHLVAPNGRVLEAFHPELRAEEIAARLRVRLRAGAA